MFCKQALLLWLYAAKARVLFFRKFAGLEQEKAGRWRNIQLKGIF